jgi:hypothetical protein
VTDQLSEYLRVDSSIVVTLVVAPFLGWFDSLWIAVLMRKDPVFRAVRWTNPVRKVRSAAYARFVNNCNDPTTQLLHRATVYRKPLLITLKSGKVYVGQPAGTAGEHGDPSVPLQSIKIIPLVSGYRNSETHKVELPTRYSDIYQLMTPRSQANPGIKNDPLAQDLADLRLPDGTSIRTDMQDIGVVILWSEIQTMSLYDENIYRAFQNSPPEQKKSKHWLGKDGVIAQVLGVLASK